MPEFDFFTDVNKKWLQENAIPQDLVTYSAFDILEKKIKGEILDIIKATKHDDGFIGSFVESAKNKANAFQQLDIFIEKLVFNSYEELYYIFGLLNLYGLSSPFEFSVSNDSRNTNKYVINIVESENNIIKEEYVKGSATYKKYESFLSQIGAEIKSNAAKTVLEMETYLSKYYYDYEDRLKIEKTYNPKTYAQLLVEYPNLTYFFKAIPFKLDTITFVVANNTLLEKTYEYIKYIPLKKWKDIIRFNIYLGLVTVLPEPFDTIGFNFLDKFMIGRKKPKSDDDKLFALCSMFCQDTIGKLYIQSDFAKFNKIKKEAVTLFNTVMKSAKKTVLKMTWLSESSRKIAHYKLECMKLQIAFPGLWTDEINEPMDPNNFIKNILTLNKTDTICDLKKLFLPQDMRVWDNACYDVNAYYYTELNLLNIPLGFLKAPFFSLEQSFIQNLAGVGNIMAHEMSHGFDEEGRKFDEKGNYKPWWVSTDIELYNSKTRQLVNFFDKEHYFGLKVSGELTLGENLADLGAMAICLAVLKERHIKMSPSKRLEELRDFFTWYAKSWVYKETKEKRTQSIQKDVHAPPQIRVNAIIRQFGEFFEAFSIGPGDPGYLAENERIDIWG
jgi:putative endopeptidase